MPKFESTRECCVVVDGEVVRDDYWVSKEDCIKCVLTNEIHESNCPDIWNVYKEGEIS